MKMEQLELGRLIRLRDEATMKQMEYLKEAGRCADERTRIEKILRNHCRHERVPDYTVVGERITHYCSICGIRL